ncbi:MAG: hypothetical protein N7Q72_06935 [Spiroplasma sp. Tabriz.8]|nr:hypothetical protein [Spiroplasma sp. Tabriz.8]
MENLGLELRSDTIKIVKFSTTCFSFTVCLFVFFFFFYFVWVQIYLY